VRKFVFKGVVALTIAMVAACAPKPPPPPPPPPPAPVVYIPPRPLPPLGAAPGLVVPPLGIDGVRVTINTGITPAQTVWNLRSAYNVAALNCLKPEHADILVGYKKFLTANKKALAAANKAVDGEYRKRFGTDWIRPREAYMTQVYNYFAHPPTLPLFCDAALAMSQEIKLAKPADLDRVSAANLARLDQVFKDFFTGYDQYRTDLAAWQSRYYPMQTTVSAAPAISLPANARAQ